MNRLIAIPRNSLIVATVLLMAPVAVADDTKLQEQLSLKVTIALKAAPNERAGEIEKFLKSPKQVPKNGLLEVPLTDLKPDLLRSLLEAQIQSIDGNKPAPKPESVGLPFSALKMTQATDGGFKVRFVGLRSDIAAAWGCDSECPQVVTAESSLELQSRRGNWGAVSQGFLLAVAAGALLGGGLWYRRRKLKKQQAVENRESGGSSVPKGQDSSTASKKEKGGNPGESDTKSLIEELAATVTNRVEAALTAKLNIFENLQLGLNAMDARQTAIKTEIIAQISRQEGAITKKNETVEQFFKIHADLFDGPEQSAQNIRLLRSHQKLATKFREQFSSKGILPGQEVSAFETLVSAPLRELDQMSKELKKANEALAGLRIAKNNFESKLAEVQATQAGLIRRLHLPTPIEGKAGEAIILDGPRWDLRLAWASAVSTLDAMSEISPPNARSARIASLLGNPEWPALVGKIRGIAVLVLDLIDSKVGTDHELARPLFKEKRDVDFILRAELLFRAYGRTDGEPTAMGMLLGMMAQSIRFFATQVGVKFAELDLLQPLPQSVAKLMPTHDTRDRQYTPFVSDDPDLMRRMKVLLDLPPDLPVLLDVIEHPFWMADGGSSKGQIVTMTVGEWVQSLPGQAKADSGKG